MKKLFAIAFIASVSISSTAMANIEPHNEALKVEQGAVSNAKLPVPIQSAGLYEEKYKNGNLEWQFDVTLDEERHVFSKADETYSFN